ncbi:MAG: hypothetical protein ACREOO_30785 [bacterium]
MAQMFSKYAGLVQLALGLLGQFVPQIGGMMNAGSGGNIFNMLSGAALSYLGFKGSAPAQRTGAQVIGGLNGLVGVLGALGVNNLAGIQLNEGAVSTVANLAIGAWGLYSGFAKPAKATAH